MIEDFAMLNTKSNSNKTLGGFVTLSVISLIFTLSGCATEKKIDTDNDDEHTVEQEQMASDIKRPISSANNTDTSEGADVKAPLVTKVSATEKELVSGWDKKPQETPFLDLGQADLGDDVLAESQKPTGKYENEPKIQFDGYALIDNSDSYEDGKHYIKAGTELVEHPENAGVSYGLQALFDPKTKKPVSYLVVISTQAGTGSMAVDKTISEEARGENPTFNIQFVVDKDGRLYDEQAAYKYEVVLKDFCVEEPAGSSCLYRRLKTFKVNKNFMDYYRKTGVSLKADSMQRSFELFLPPEMFEAFFKAADDVKNLD